MLKRSIKFERLLLIISTLNPRTVSKVTLEIDYNNKKIILKTPTFIYNIIFEKQNPFLTDISDDEFAQKIDEIFNAIKKNNIMIELNKK